MVRVRYNHSLIEVLEETQKQLNVKEKSSEAACKICSVNVVSKVVQNCCNTSVPITAIETGAMIKVPVVLAELTVQVSMDFLLELPQYAYDIKQLKKQIEISQCYFLHNTNVLFIQGSVIKNIDYIICPDPNSQHIYEDYFHSKVDIPFSCTTSVTFNGYAPFSSVENETKEFEYFKQDDNFNSDSSLENPLLSEHTQTCSQITTTICNELPYCELVSSKIVEVDEYLYPVQVTNSLTSLKEKYFNRIEANMVIYVTLRLLQNRVIAVPSTSKTQEDDLT